VDEKILFEVDGDIAIIRLNDPATLNALSPASYHGLTEALGEAERSARAVVLTSAGRAFCAGANLAEGRMDPADPAFDCGALLESHANPMMLRMRDLRIPIVAAVVGAAAGIGCSLALAADLIVASDTAYFLQAFSRIGLVPDGGSPYLLAASAGRARAMEMMLLGDRLPAATALEWGLINRVVPEGAVEATARDLARRLADGPVRTLGHIRRLAWAALETPWEQQLALERAAQREAGRSAEFREGIAAFAAKRPADFRGVS
jgi:2-(1,2-epoxy-1,2-dihydrophenyl)acetyl-CoA isomerase